MFMRTTDIERMRRKKSESVAGIVIFAASGTEPLLGVTALESVGIMVDPTDKTLKLLPAIPLK